MALPKKNRFTRNKDIDTIFKNGRTVRSSSLFVKIVKNNLGYSRFAFAIPSKYITMAVDRNKVKRLFSEEIKKIPILPGGNYDIVVVVSKKVRRDQLKYLAAELKGIFLKL